MPYCPNCGMEYQSTARAQQMSEDLYSALGVSRNANEDEIKHAYRRKAGENHPDVNDDPNAIGEFKRIQHAKEVLTDEEKRTAYDQMERETSYCSECGSLLDESLISSTDDSAVGNKTDDDVGNSTIRQPTDENSNNQETFVSIVSVNGKFISYIGGILIFLWAIAEIPLGGRMGVAIMFISGSFLLPITRKTIKNRFSISFSRWAVVVIVVFTLLVGLGKVGYEIS